MYKKYKLKNKLQVILAPQKETKAVTVLVLVGVGSRYEKNAQAGMAHFLEHMLFKGTPRRPTTLALSKELDKVGAEFNAYTSEDHTAYYIKINAEHLELALDMLSDMVWNSKLEDKEIKRESGTIIEEINMYEDDPKRMVNSLIQQLIFKGNSLGREVLGSKKTVRNVTHNKMKIFKNKYYLPHNIIISVAGNIESQQVQALVERYFGGNGRRTLRHISAKRGKIGFQKFKAYQAGPQINLKYKDSAQVHLDFGFVGPSYKDKDLIAAQVLSALLGGMFSSRLFINVRERQGLCYYIHSAVYSYQDTGIFLVKSGLDKNRIFQAIQIILNELRKIKAKGVSQQELNKAKENIKGKMILALEDSLSVAEWYGNQQLLVGKVKTPEQKIAEIMQITKPDVDRAARKIFQTKKINLALIGPFKYEKDFLRLLKI